MELPKDSLGTLLERSENVDAVEPVDTQRCSSGQAPIAGVGDVEGEGEDRRSDGWSEPCGTAMIASGDGEERRNEGCAGISLRSRSVILLMGGFKLILG